YSSRRRHTRFSRDWSSDLCSSDLGGYVVAGGRHCGQRDLLAHPGRKVVLEAQVAVGVGEELIDDQLAQVVVVVEPELLLERGELAQRAERLDLLRATRVDVDGEVAERRRRQHLGRLGPRGEEAPG